MSVSRFSAQFMCMSESHSVWPAVVCVCRCESVCGLQQFVCISESFQRTVYVYVRVVLWPVVVCVCVGVSQSVACSSLCVCQ